MPAPPKHTIVGLGRDYTTYIANGSPAEAHCSCGWNVEAAGAAYVGTKVAEHLRALAGVSTGVAKWASRANLAFTGHRV